MVIVTGDGTKKQGISPMFAPHRWFVVTGFSGISDDSAVVRALITRRSYIDIRWWSAGAETSQPRPRSRLSPPPPARLLEGSIDACAPWADRRFPKTVPRFFSSDRYTADLYDLYKLARVSGWEKDDLHDLARVSWVGSVLLRSCTTSRKGM